MGVPLLSPLPSDAPLRFFIFTYKTKIINKKEFDEYASNTQEGIDSISNLKYNIDDYTGFVNVTAFDTPRVEDTTTKSEYDLRNGNTPYAVKSTKTANNNYRRKPQIKMFF